MTRKITALKLQKRNKNRVNVYLDNEFAFGLSHIVAAWLKTGQFLSQSEIEELKAKDAKEQTLQKALHFLSFRPRSEAEVRNNLRKHQFEEETITETIERLQNGKLLNDTSFAQQWVENRNEFRPRGKRALRAELRQKGIAESIINETVRDLDEQNLADQAAIKQASRYKGLEWLAFRKKMYGFLSRRGFSYQEVDLATRKAWEQISNSAD